jgi:hypothetical protein
MQLSISDRIRKEFWAKVFDLSPEKESRDIRVFGLAALFSHAERLQNTHNKGPINFNNFKIDRI